MAVWLAVLVGSSGASAQATKMVRGTVTAVGQDSVTVKGGAQAMTFTVDLKTTVTTPGAGAKAIQARVDGKAGVALSDLVKVGQTVRVDYTESGGSMHASQISFIGTASTSGESKPKAAAPRAMGTVMTVAPDSITIKGTSGGGAFTQAYAIKPSTHLIANGAGRAATINGGRIPVTDIVGVGDTVRITYQKAGAMLSATQIEVTAKAR